VSGKKSRLLVGIGSPFGDDQAGWTIADRLREKLEPIGDVSVRRASVPIDLLDWLDGIECLHVCDAYESAAEPATLHCWEYSPRSAALSHGRGDASELQNFASLRSTCSHDFGLMAVLELASRLGRLPAQVIVWGLEGQRFGVDDQLSPEIANRLPEIERAIIAAISYDGIEVGGRAR
jgi:hydrogenase maturation protease